MLLRVVPHLPYLLIPREYIMHESTASSERLSQRESVHSHCKPFTGIYQQEQEKQKRLLSSRGKMRLKKKKVVSSDNGQSHQTKSQTDRDSARSNNFNFFYLLFTSEYIST